MWIMTIICDENLIAFTLHYLMSNEWTAFELSAALQHYSTTAVVHLCVRVDGCIVGSLVPMCLQ